jgi:uroporphyrinogen decarboxylase
MPTETISPRERVLRSIRHQSLDAVPWQMDLTRGVEIGLKKYYQSDDLILASGDHIKWVKPLLPPALEQAALEPGLVRGEFGDIWRMRDEMGNWGELIHCPIPEPTLSGYTLPDPSLPGRFAHIPALRAQYADRFFMVSLGGLFERAWSLCGGFERYLFYIAAEPKFVEELTAKLADYVCALVPQLTGMGIDGVRVGDDWGFQHHLMIRPEIWRRVFKPHYRRIFDTIHAHDFITAMHSCGHLTKILPDLIEIGLEVYHPLQPEAMDVAAVKRNFGKDITFWGGLGTQTTLPLGTPADVRREVRARIDLFQQDGGYILAPAGAMSPETPVENVVAFIETAQAQLAVPTL